MEHAQADVEMLWLQAAALVVLNEGVVGEELLHLLTAHDADMDDFRMILNPKPSAALLLSAAGGAPSLPLPLP